MYNTSRHIRSILISAAVRIVTPVAFLLLAAALAPSATAQPSSDTSTHAKTVSADAPDGDVTPVEARFVCMITNKVFAEEQIRIPLNDRVYYGCCQMCVAKVNDNPESRYTTDPVTGNRVNKADAVIGADSSGKVYYFESGKTLDAFNAR